MGVSAIELPGRAPKVPRAFELVQANGDESVGLPSQRASQGIAKSTSEANAIDEAEEEEDSHDVRGAWSDEEAYEAYTASLRSGGQAREQSAPVDSEAEDEFSDVSSDSDIFHAEVFEDKSWTTEQDEREERIDYIASLLRSRPLLPPHPQNPFESWLDTDSGVAFHRAHCAFKGCHGLIAEDRSPTF